MKRERPDEDTATTRGRAATMATGPDTEGHSMLTYELGLTLERERRRQAERAVRDAGWSATRERGTRLRRLLGGWSSAAATVRAAGHGLAEASRRWAALTGGGVSAGLGAY